MLLHNLGGIFTGDAHAPTADADSLGVGDGAVIAAAAADPAHRLDGRGGWAMPGLWDGAMNIYFGDHTPTFSATGAMAAAVDFGVTNAVAAGPAPVPGAVPAARFQRELAVLTLKSWAHERPRGLHVHAGTLTGHAGWDADDLQDLAACGASVMLLPAWLPADEAVRLSKTGRAAGLRIGLRLDGADNVDAAALDEVLTEARPALATGVNTVGIPGDVVDRLVTAEGCALGLVLAGDLAVAARVVRACVERGEPGRPFLGTGTPDERGVLPAGMALLIDVLAGMAGVAPGLAVAMASGNVAKAFGRPGGQLLPGQPADVVVLDRGAGFVSPWLRRPLATLIDGNPHGSGRG